MDSIWALRNSRWFLHHRNDLQDVVPKPGLSIIEKSSCLGVTKTFSLAGMPHPGLSLEIKIKELRKIITDGNIHCNLRKYMGSYVMWRLWLKEHRPQHQANSKQFQGTGQKLPSKKVHLEVKKTPLHGLKK